MNRSCVCLADCVTPIANITEKPKIVKRVMRFVKAYGFDSMLIPHVRAFPSAFVNLVRV
jgi:hypothetical protein